jgi:peptide methionine sulfoxide reductase MsrB
MDGKLYPEYEVHCPGCETPMLGLGRTKKAAEEELSKAGWRQRRGLWRCAACDAALHRSPDKEPAHGHPDT